MIIELNKAFLNQKSRIQNVKESLLTPFGGAVLVPFLDF